ncbi:MAG TPA: hypothetical protein VKB93_29920 [Thermoanaerobaculia bacterium]|nr:hypothetical protein [Thermoanaerobaculia bacterium]
MKAALGWVLCLGATAMFGQEPPELKPFILLSSHGELSRPMPVVRSQAVGWVLNGEHHHVTVSAHLGNGGGRAPFEAYLMRTIGPGTTRRDEIAGESFDLPYPFDGWVDLFTDLDLAPGEYWLIIGRSKETAFSSINWFVETPRQLTGSCTFRYLGSQSYIFYSDTADYLPASKFEKKVEPYGFEFEVFDLRPAGMTECP